MVAQANIGVSPTPLQKTFDIGGRKWRLEQIGINPKFFSIDLQKDEVSGVHPVLEQFGEPMRLEMKKCGYLMTEITKALEKEGHFDFEATLV